MLYRGVSHNLGTEEKFVGRAIIEKEYVNNTLLDLGFWTIRSQQKLDVLKHKEDGVSLCMSVCSHLLGLLAVFALLVSDRLPAFLRARVLCGGASFYSHCVQS